MAGYISPDTVDQISQQADIVQVISEYVPLTPAGNNYRALCPFHQEKTPSFVVSPEKQVFHCFGCGTGGNVFTFVMKWEGVSFPQAVRVLAQKLGISIASDKSVSQQQKFYQINKKIAEFFHQQLKRNNFVKKYLQKRGFKPDTIRTFTLGWAPSSRIFINFCRKNDLPQELLKELGLLKTSSRNEGQNYSYFRQRIIFPIFSLSGKIIGFGGRVIDDSLPKYLNSPQSPVFDKGKSLYGLHLAKAEVRQSSEAILVEGYTDVVALHQEGICNVVASLGTSLTTYQARVLKRYADTIFLAYDQDTAGQAATIRGIDILLQNDLQVKIIPLPEEKDPADFIRTQGKDAFVRLKQKALPYIEYRINLAIQKNKPLSLDKKLNIVNSLFFTLEKVKSRNTLDEMLKRLSEAVEFNEESLRSEFARFCRKKSNFSFSPTLKFKVPEQAEIEKKLLQVMLCDKEAIKVVKGNFSCDDFSHPVCRRVAQEIFLCPDVKNITPSYLINRVAEDDICALVSSLSLDDYSLQGFDVEKVTREVIQTLKRRSHQKRIKQLSRLIENYEKRGDEEKVKNLCQELVQLRKSMLII